MRFNCSRRTVDYRPSNSNNCQLQIKQIRALSTCVIRLVSPFLSADTHFKSSADKLRKEKQYATIIIFSGAMIKVSNLERRLIIFPGFFWNLFFQFALFGNAPVASRFRFFIVSIKAGLTQRASDIPYPLIPLGADWCSSCGQYLRKNFSRLSCFSRVCLAGC